MKISDAIARGSFKEDEFMNKIGIFVVTCNEPFADVERPAFRSLLQYVRKDVKLPHRLKIREHIMGWFVLSLNSVLPSLLW